MISKKLSTALGVTIILITIAFLLSSDGEVASASAGSNNLIPSATFPANAGTLGNIPDLASGCQPTQGAPLNVTFTVAGVTPPLGSVELSMGGFHSWIGDLTTTLIAPNGASHTVFGRTLATTGTASGDSSDLGAGPYVFKDSAAAPPNGGWWQTANILGATAAMTAGDYRTTASGGAGATNPMPPTNMNAAFAGVANPNGTWTLRVTDGCAADTGNISAASLTLTSAVPGDTNVDFNGDGKTDYVVARGTNTPLAENLAGMRPGRNNYSALDERPVRNASTETASIVPDAPPIYWYTLFNTSGATLVQQFGDAATDFVLAEDWDADNKDDLTIWRSVAGNGQFWTYRSATNTVMTESFGLDGDDPAVIGDYDGDNKADAAVYRCPGFGNPAGQCYFFYRGSLNNPGGNITYVPWGFGVDGDFFAYVGDFDGDGKNDFCIQRSHPAIPTNGQFVLLKSATLTTEFINWGFASDFLIPGDYDGDGKTDLCVRRTVSGVRNHYVLTRTGASIFAQWGISGDSSAPGDYDGDGRTDFAIWRGSSTPGASGFWVLNSGSGSASFTGWGQCAAACDFAVAGWAVH